ncbi:MAG: FtsX-like permease family protein, partial [bacterium]
VIQRDMQSFFMILPAIVGVFIMVSFLILFFSLSRMVQQDMAQLGTLLALGYSPFQLFGAYVIGGSILGLAGYFIGCAGSNSLASLVVKSYMSGTGLPLMFRSYNRMSFLIAFLFSLAAPMIATALSLMQIRRMNVAEMLGRTIEKQWSWSSLSSSSLSSSLWSSSWLSDVRKKLADSALLAPLIDRWNHLFERGITFKIGMRNLWRRKVFFLLSAFSIALGIALAESLLIADVSIYRTIDNFFTMEKWDLFIPFSGSVEKQKVEKLKEIEGIAGISLYKKGLVNLHLGDERKPYQIAGISRENSLIKPDVIEGSSFSSDDAREIILNAEMKDQYNLKIGDSIDVWTGNEPKGRLKLVGVMNNFVAGQAFVPMGVAQDMSGRKDRFTGVFLALCAPFEKIRSKIQRLDFTGYIVRKDDARATFHINMKKISVFLYTYSLISLFLSMCIIFVNLYLNTVYRKGEYAVLLANGFGQREIGLMIVYEILAIMVIVTAAAIPLSIMISKYFCYKIAKAAVTIHLQIRPVDYLKVFIPMLVLMSAVAWYCTRYASSIDITSTIRNRINE